MIRITDGQVNTDSDRPARRGKEWNLVVFYNGSCSQQIVDIGVGKKQCDHPAWSLGDRNRGEITEIQNFKFNCIRFSLAHTSALC